MPNCLICELHKHQVLLQLAQKVVQFVTLSDSRNACDEFGKTRVFWVAFIKNLAINKVHRGGKMCTLLQQNGLLYPRFCINIALMIHRVKQT